MREICSRVEQWKLTTRAFDSEAELEKEALGQETSGPFLAALVFSQLSDKRLHYRLRFPHYHRSLLPQYFSENEIQDWATKVGVPDSLFAIRNSYPALQDGGLPAYWRTGFLALQNIVHDVFLQKVADKTSGFFYNSYREMRVELERFPFPSHVEHPVYSYIEVIGEFLLVLIFLVSVLRVSRTLGSQLSDPPGQKKYVCVMGLSGLSFWGAHLLLNAALSLFPVALVAAGLQLLFPCVSLSLQFVLTLLYALNAIGLALLVTSLTGGGPVGSVSAAVVWWLLVLPALTLQQRGLRLPLSAQIAADATINPPFTHAIRVFHLAYNSSQPPLSSPPSQPKSNPKYFSDTSIGWGPELFEKHGDFSLATLMVFMLLEFIVFLALTAFVESVPVSVVNITSTREFDTAE